MKHTISSHQCLQLCILSVFCSKYEAYLGINKVWRQGNDQVEYKKGTNGGSDRVWELLVLADGLSAAESQLLVLLTPSWPLLLYLAIGGPATGIRAVAQQRAIGNATCGTARASIAIGKGLIETWQMVIWTSCILVLSDSDVQNMSRRKTIYIEQKRCICHSVFSSMLRCHLDQPLCPNTSHTKPFS